ncbi:hypothetical protein WDV93_16800 [Pantoea ananatis]
MSGRLRYWAQQAQGTLYWNYWLNASSRLVNCICWRATTVPVKSNVLKDVLCALKTRPV